MRFRMGAQWKKKREHNLCAQIESDLFFQKKEEEEQTKKHNNGMYTHMHTPTQNKYDFSDQDIEKDCDDKQTFVQKSAATNNIVARKIIVWKMESNSMAVLSSSSLLLLLYSSVGCA